MRRIAPLFLLLQASCLWATQDEHTLKRTLEVDGRTRTYYVHVPPNVLKPAPAVLFFHGGGGTGLGSDRQTGFNALSDKEGFIVVWPEGVGRNWNDGREIPESEAHSDKVDDLKFVGVMLDALGREFAVDSKRVFATGISNGGCFSHHLAAHLADRIAAIAPVVGGLPEPLRDRFKPSHPVSVLILQGTEDPLVPFGGGDIVAGRKKRGRIVSTAEATALWIASTGVGKGVEVSWPDRDPDDACRVSAVTHSGGKDGAEVVQVTITGGGHTWPGGRQYLPQGLIGRVCRDFDATSVIWEFFKAHARKP